MPITVVVLTAASATGLAGRSFSTNSSQQGEAPEPETDVPPASVAGPGVVRFSKDAAQHPAYDAVRSVLQNHFDSINQSFYERWQTTVVEQRERESPKSEWEDDYITTSDSDIKVHRIEPGPEGSLRVLMTFTSEQAQEDSPDKVSTCLRWTVTYPLVMESDQLLLDASDYGSSSVYRPC